MLEFIVEGLRVWVLGFVDWGLGFWEHVASGVIPVPGAAS